MSYSFLRSSRRELAAAVQWYEDRRDGLGDEFLEEFNRCMSLIVRRPETFAVDETAPAGYPARFLLFRRFPYRVIYGLREGRVVVLAVAHTAQKPDYWFDRLEEE
jgi:hypothetical protein